VIAAAVWLNQRILQNAFNHGSDRMKTLTDFMREHDAFFKPVKVLLIFGVFTSLAYLLGEFTFEDGLTTFTTLALFGAAGSVNVYLVPRLVYKESTKWQALLGLVALGFIFFYLVASDIFYLPLLSTMLVGAFTGFNLLLTPSVENLEPPRRRIGTTSLTDGTSRESKVFQELRGILREILLPLGFVETEAGTLGRSASYRRDDLLVELYFDVREREYAFFATKKDSPRQARISFNANQYDGAKPEALRASLREWLKTIEA
jgi:hypothetical protein